MAGDPGEGVLFTNRGAGPRRRRDLPARRTPARIRCATPAQGEHNLAKPNFGYQKRQKELEKKRKKEEKLKRKLEKGAPPATDEATAADAPPPAPESGEAA